MSRRSQSSRYTRTGTRAQVRGRCPRATAIDVLGSFVINSSKGCQNDRVKQFSIRANGRKDGGSDGHDKQHPHPRAPEHWIVGGSLVQVRRERSHRTGYHFARSSCAIATTASTLVAVMMSATAPKAENSHPRNLRPLIVDDRTSSIGEGWGPPHHSQDERRGAALFPRRRAGEPAYRADPRVLCDANRGWASVTKAALFERVGRAAVPGHPRPWRARRRW
jgi:hypothetical protein